VCPSGKLNKVDRGSGSVEEDGRESSAPEKLFTFSPYSLNNCSKVVKGM
jgi:hypothetical protein